MTEQQRLETATLLKAKGFKAVAPDYWELGPHIAVFTHGGAWKAVVSGNAYRDDDAIVALRHASARARQFAADLVLCADEVDALFAEKEADGSNT